MGRAAGSTSYAWQFKHYIDVTDLSTGRVFMFVLALNDESAEAFAEEPELAMCVQLGEVLGKMHLILAAGIAIPLNSEDGPKALAGAVSKLLSTQDTVKTLPDRLEEWRQELDPVYAVPAENQSLASLDKQHLSALVAFTMPTSPYVPSPPASPAHVYGHLPFKGKTSTGDAFLRFEPWPTSRRVKGTTVTAGTYAGPISEQHLVPNGFAAVGRYALPNLLPACTVWKIEPKPGTDLAVGASVPLYGQAGGGAEVCFTNGTTKANIGKEPSLPVL